MPTDRKWESWSPSDTMEAPEVSTEIESPTGLMDAPEAEPPRVSGMGWQTGMERPKKGQVIAPAPITTYQQYQAAMAEHYFGRPPEQVQLEEADLFEFKGEGLEDRVFGWRKNEQTGDFQWHSRPKEDSSAPLTPDPKMVGVDKEGQRKPFEELPEEEQRTRFLEGVQEKLDPDEFEVVSSLFMEGSFPEEYSPSEAIEIVLDIEDKLEFELLNREDLDAITVQEFRKAELSRVISDLANRIKKLPSATPGETHPPDKSTFDQYGKPIGEEQRYIYYPVGLENVAGRGAPASTTGLPGLLQHFYQYGTLQNVVGLTNTGPDKSGSKKHDWSWYNPSETQIMWGRFSNAQEMLIQADDKTINKFIEDFSESFLFWSSVAYAEADGLNWEMVAEKQGRNFVTEPQKQALHLAKRQEVDSMWVLGAKLLSGVQTTYGYHGRVGDFKHEDALKGRDIKDFLDWATKSGYLPRDLPRYDPEDIRPGYYREWMYDNYQGRYSRLFDQLAPYYKSGDPTTGEKAWDPRKSGPLGWQSGKHPKTGLLTPYRTSDQKRFAEGSTTQDFNQRTSPGLNSPLKELRGGESEDFNLPPILHAYFAYRQGKDLATHEIGFDPETLKADTGAYQHALLAFRPRAVTGGPGGPLSEGGMSLEGKGISTNRVLAEIHPNEFGGARYRVGSKTPSAKEITRWSEELNEDENAWWDPFGLTSAVFTPEGYIWSGQMATEIEGAFSAPEGHVENETMRALIDGSREEIAKEPNVERRVALMRRWLNDSIWRKTYIEGYAERAAYRNARGTIGLSNAMEANVIAPEMVQFAIDAWGNIDVAQLQRALVTKYMNELWLSDYSGLYHTQESMPEDAQERLRMRARRFAKADVARFGSIAIQGGALLIDTDPYGKSEELATLPFYSRIPRSALAPKATVGYGGYNFSETVMSPHEESAPLGDSVPKRSSTQIQVHELQHQSSLNSFFRIFPTTWMAGMLEHQLAETKNIKDMSAGEEFIQSLIYGTSEGGLTHDQLRERSQDRNWWVELGGFATAATSPGLAISRAAAMKMSGTETGTDWTLLPEVVWDFFAGTFAVGKDYETRLRQVDAIRENEFLAVSGGEMFGQLANSLEMSSEQTEWMKRAGMVLYFAPEFITGMDPISAPLLAMRGGLKATKATARFLTYSPRVMRKAVKDLDAAVESGNIDKIRTALKRTQSIIKKNNAPAHQLSIMETAVEAGLSGPYLRAMDRLAEQAIKAEDAAKDAAKAAGVVDDSPIFIPGMDYVNPVRRRVWTSNRTRELIAAGKVPQEAVDLARAEVAEIAKQQTIRAMEITKPGDVYRVSEDGVTTFYVRLQEDGEDVIRPWMHITEETGEIIQAGAHTVDTPTFKISPKGFVGETDVFLTFDGLGKPVSTEKILGGLKSNHVLFSGVTFDEAGKAIGVGNFVDDLRLVRWNVQGAEYAPRSAPAEVASAYGIPPRISAGPPETAARVEQFAPGGVGVGPETAGRAAELGRRYHTAQAIVLRIQHEAAMARAGQLSELAESFRSGHGAIYKTWTNQREILISLNKEIDELRNTFTALNDTAENTLRELAIARDGLSEVNSILKRIAQGTEGINGKIGSRLTVPELRKSIADRIAALRNQIKDDHLNLDAVEFQVGDSIDAMRADLARHEKQLQEILETAKRLSTKGGMEQYVSAVKQEQAAFDAYSKVAVKYKDLQKAEAAAISRLTEIHITRQAAAQVVFGTEKAIARNVKTIEKNDRLIAISDEIEEARKAGASEERIGRLEMKWNRAVADAMTEGDVAGFYASIPEMENALTKAAASAESSAAKIGRSYEAVRKLSGALADETFEVGKIETALKKKWDALHVKNRAEAYSRVVRRMADFLEEGEKALKDAPSLSSDFKSILAGAIVKKPESVSAFRAMLRKIRGFEDPPTGMHDGKYIIDANELRVLLETTWGQASIDRIIELISAGGGTRGGEAGDLLRLLLSKSDEGVPVPGAPTGEVTRGIQIRQQVNDLSEKLKKVQNMRGRAKSPNRIETLDKRIEKLTAQIDELTEEYWTKVVRPESILDEAATGPKTLDMILDDIPSGPSLKWGEGQAIELTTGWNLGGTKEVVFKKMAEKFPEIWPMLDDTEKAIFAREMQLHGMSQKIEEALYQPPGGAMVLDGYVMEPKDGAKILGETVLPYISDPSQKAILKHLLDNGLLEDCTVAVHHFDRIGDSLRAVQGHMEVMPWEMKRDVGVNALASITRSPKDPVRSLNLRGLDPLDEPQISSVDGSVFQGFSAKTGISPRTVVHELLHVATEKILYDAKHSLNLGTRLSNATEDLYAIKDIVRKVLDDQDPNWERKASLFRDAPSWYQAVLISGVDELITYGLTSKPFQEFLDGIPLSKVWKEGERGQFAAFLESGRSLFSVISDVVRRLIRLPGGKATKLQATGVTETALDEVIRLSGEILDQSPRRIDEFRIRKANAWAYGKAPPGWSPVVEDGNRLLKTGRFSAGELQNLPRVPEKYVGEARARRAGTHPGQSAGEAWKAQLVAGKAKLKIAELEVKVIQAQLRYDRLIEPLEAVDVYYPPGSAGRASFSERMKEAISLARKIKRMRRELGKLKEVADEDLAILGWKRDEAIWEDELIAAIDNLDEVDTFARLKSIDSEITESLPKRGLQPPPFFTPEFKKWIKGTKVVDDSGEPLKMYHGGPYAQKIEAFETYGTKYGLMGTGAYFTSDASVAAAYASSKRAQRIAKRANIDAVPTVTPVYLKITNPIDMDAVADSKKWLEAINRSVGYLDGEDIIQALPKLSTEAKNKDWLRAVEEVLQSEEIVDWEGAEFIRDIFEGMGYNGLTHLETKGMGITGEVTSHRVYVAFDSPQIRSAHGLPDGGDRTLFSISGDGPRPAPAAGEVPEPFYPRPGAERKFEPVPPPPSVKAGGFDSSLGPNEVALKLEEVRTLEEINGYLHKAWKITHEKASEIAMTEALQLARKDVFNQLFRYETLDNFITRGVKQWAARMDPVRIQVGESSKEVREVFRAARNMSDQVRSDLARLGRMGEEQILRDMAKQEGIAAWATMTEEQLEEQLKLKFNLAARRRYIANRVMDEYFIPFLDDVTPIDLDIRVPVLPVIARPKLLRTTWANSIGGNKTIWQQSRQWLMSDPRMRPGGMKAYIKEHDELLSIIDSTIEKAGALKQNKNLPISEWKIPTTEHRVADHTIQAVQRTLREGSGTSELKLGMRQKFKETGFDPKTWAVASSDELKASKNKDVLRGLLRSFLPHGENLWGFGKAEDALLVATYKILQSENGVSAFKFKESMLDMLSKRRFIPEAGQYFEGFSRASMENARSYAFFSELVGHGAVFQRANELSIKATGGFLSVDEVKAANQILDHQQWKNMQPGDVAKGLAAILNPLGRPFTQSAIKLTKDMERFTNMIRTGEDITGRGYHMSRSLVDAIDAQLGAVIKELRPLNQGVREPTINAITGALKTWRTSVVTGLIVPRPMYFLNNFAGDISQVWSELGIAQSSRTNFQLLTGIPWMSKRFYGYRRWMRERVGAENVLPDLGNSIFNPTIARIFAGEKFTIRTKSGLVVDSRDLLRGAIERGVMDSYANVDLLNQMTKIGKSSKWDALRAMAGWQDDIAETATYVQQRQRFALYCDLIRQGKTEEYAAKKVMDALYDWKNGISEWEARYLNNTIAFYRFWRLAIRQQMRLFMEPLTKPTFGKDGQLVKALMGSTYSSRVRQQYIALNQLPQFIDPVVQEDYEETEGLLNELVRIGGLPDWVGHARGVPTFSRVPSSTTEHWMKTRGSARPVTHEFSTTGPFTSIEISTLMADYFQGMAGALIEHLPSTYLGLGDQEWGDELKMSLNPNWKSNFYKMPMEMLHPHQKEFVKSALARFGNQTAAGYTTDEIQLKPMESWLIKNTSLLWGLDESDINIDEFGRETGPAFSLTLWRLFPVVTEFNGLFSRAYFENPELTQFWETKDMQDFSVGFQSFLGRHTGLTIPGTEIQGQRYPVAAPWPQLSTTSWTAFPDDLSKASGIPAQIARRQYVQQMYTKELFEEHDHLIPKSTDLEKSIGAAAAKGEISEWATPDMEEAFRIDAERRRLRKEAEARESE